MSIRLSCLYTGHFHLFEWKITVLLKLESEFFVLVNFDRVTKESEDLIDEALKQCQNGTKSIDPQVWIMDATTANGR